MDPDLLAVREARRRQRRIAAGAARAGCDPSKIVTAPFTMALRSAARAARRWRSNLTLHRRHGRLLHRAFDSLRLRRRVQEDRRPLQGQGHALAGGRRGQRLPLFRRAPWPATRHTVLRSFVAAGFGVDLRIFNLPTRPWEMVEAFIRGMAPTGRRPVGGLAAEARSWPALCTFAAFKRGRHAQDARRPGLPSEGSPRARRARRSRAGRRHRPDQGRSVRRLPQRLVHGRRAAAGHRVPPRSRARGRRDHRRDRRRSDRLRAGAARRRWLERRIRWALRCLSSRRLLRLPARPRDGHLLGRRVRRVHDRPRGGGGALPGGDVGRGRRPADVRRPHDLQRAPEQRGARGRPRRRPGIGGLGHLGVQFAAKMGFFTVAIARGSDKEPLAKKLGASQYIDSNARDPAAELTKLGGAKVILCTDHEREGDERDPRRARTSGTLLVVGVPPNRSSARRPLIPAPGRSPAGIRAPPSTRRTRSRSASARRCAR